MGRKKARGNGQGAIVTIRRKGKIVGYAPEISIPGGKPPRKRGELKKTRGEAEIALAELQRQYAQGVDLTAPTLTLAAYAERWFIDVFVPGAALKSQVDYRGALDRYILPHLGSIPLKKLQAPRIRQWLNHLQKPKAEGGMGLSARTAALARTVLSSALGQAVDDKLITENPIDARRVRRPKIPRSGAKALTVAQAKALLAALRGDRNELPLRLMLSLALRSGEVCGLRYEDIQLDADPPRLTVAGTLGYITGHGLVYREPKTEDGRRTLRLPARLVAALRWHLTRLEAERKAMEGKWQQDCPYIFVSARKGGPLNTQALWASFQRAAKQIGLEGFRPHDLRHSAASFLHAEGVPIKNISKGMGHASTSITLDTYTHLWGDVHDIGEFVDRLLDDDDTTDAPEAKQA
jgi:integrase